MDRPYVIVANGASLDGRLGPRMLPDPRWFELWASHEHPVRVEWDARLTGADTLWPFDSVRRPPASADVHPAVDFAVDHVVDPKPGVPVFAFTDSRGRLPEDAYAEGDGPGHHRVVLVSAKTPLVYLAFLRERDVSYLVCGDLRVDLAEALRRLRKVFGVERVLCDGGGALYNALLQKGLVDEVYVEILPVIFGGSPGARLFDGPAFDPEVMLDLVGADRQEDGLLRLHYRVRR